jgi:hypothetical protein
VISISAFAVFLLKKQITHITDAIVLNHKLETSLKKRIELLSVVKHDAQIVDSNDILINNAFIPSNNILEFINALDNLAISNGVTQIYRFETPVPSAISGPFPLSDISYSNNISTNVLKFSKYLKDMEKLPYFTNIESLNISSQDKAGWINSATISFQATLITKATQ